MLVSAPASKVFTFGADVGPVEPVVGNAWIARQGIAQAVSELVTDGWLAESDVPGVVHRVMRGNQYEVFRLEEKTRAIRSAALQESNVMAAWVSAFPPSTSIRAGGAKGVPSRKPGTLRNRHRDTEGTEKTGARLQSRISPLSTSSWRSWRPWRFPSCSAALRILLFLLSSPRSLRPLPSHLAGTSRGPSVSSAHIIL